MLRVMTLSGPWQETWKQVLLILLFPRCMVLTVKIDFMPLD